MFKILISSLVFFLLFDTVYADEFFVSGEMTQNLYYDTLGYGIGELLESKKCPNCIEYMEGDVYGTYSSEIVGDTDIFDVANQDWRYGLARKKGMYDRVSLPPYSSLDFIYWSKSMAWEDVNVVSLKVFLSRYYPSQGDLRNLLYIDGEYEEIPLKYLIYNYPRNGVVKTYPGVGVVKSGEGKINGMILDRVYVKSPLLFEKWEAEEHSGSILLRVYVRNSSEELLKNISYTHSGHTLVRDYSPLEEYIYEYVLDFNGDGNLGYAGIYNPNSKTECVALGEHIESTYIGESPIITGIREKNGQMIPYIGSRVKPFGDSFCVTRIPYTMYSGEMNIYPEEDDIYDESIVEEWDIEDVLGIEKLPQTSVNISSFLVVFPILWYYLIRRRYR